jgi:hypothetical protein
LRELKRIRNQLLTDALPRLERYTEQRRLLGKRNSMSRTDPDATFMRRKEDALQSQDLRPCYNLLIGTEGQFITGYSVHQNAADNAAIPAHLQQIPRVDGALPTVMVGDAGCGNEQIYTVLEAENVTPYIKYNTFHHEQKREVRDNPFLAANMPYDTQNDRYHCPAGKELVCVEEGTIESTTGFLSTVRTYRAEDCDGCAFRKECTKGEGPRTISRRPRLEEYRDEVRVRLHTPTGRYHRSQRGVEVEATFGQLKQNMGMRRLQLRGLPLVTVEVGLYAMAHNMKKCSLMRRKREQAERMRNGWVIEPIMTDKMNNAALKIRPGT